MIRTQAEAEDFNEFLSNQLNEAYELDFKDNVLFIYCSPETSIKSNTLGYHFLEKMNQFVNINFVIYRKNIWRIYFDNVGGVNA